MQHPDKQQSTAILVLGMHRSGTSAATRILNMLGAHLGSQLLAPQADNKKGFWEHVEAVDIHERLLYALGRNWHDTREMPAGWLKHPAARLAVDEIVDLIRRDMGGARLWAIKDPRMCRLAELWLEALERLGVRATVVMVVRAPIEVARSLHVRDGWTHAHTYLMWAQHVLESFRSTMTVPRVMLSYDELMNDWGMSFQRVGEELNISWSRTIADARLDVDAFISPEERHHYAAQHANHNFESELPPKFLGRLYDSCKQLVKDGRGWDQIASCNYLYQEIAPIFLAPISEIFSDKQEFERLSVERLHRIHYLEGEQARSFEDNSRLIADNSRLQKDNLKWLEANSKLQQANSRLQEDNSRLQKDLSRLETEKSTFETIAAERMQQIERFLAEKANLEKALEDCRERYNNVQSLVQSRLWLLKRLTRLLLSHFLPKQRSDEF